MVCILKEILEMERLCGIVSVMDKRVQNKEVISRAQVEYVARLANIPLIVNETPGYQKQLSDILGHVESIDKVGEIGTLDVQKVSKGVFRKDETLCDYCLTQEQSTKNGPKVHNGLFVVPPVLGVE